MIHKRLQHNCGDSDFFIGKLQEIDYTRLWVQTMGFYLLECFDFLLLDKAIAKGLHCVLLFGEVNGGDVHKPWLLVKNTNDGNVALNQLTFHWVIKKKSVDLSLSLA